METGWLIAVAICIAFLIRFLFLFYKESLKCPIEKKEASFGRLPSKTFHLKNVYPPKRSIPIARTNTEGKRRYFYGDQVCDHDRNYLKAALKGYIKGHYFFNYHGKQFRVPEIWK